MVVENSDLIGAFTKFEYIGQAYTLKLSWR